MAITGATLTAIDEAIKTFYTNVAADYLNNSNVLSSVVEVNERDVVGKDATIHNHYGRSTGTGSRADGGALPTASYQKYKTTTVPMKNHYGRIEVTGPTIAATRDPRGSYEKALDSEIMGSLKDTAKERNRQLAGAGYGTLARWRSTSSGTVYTLQKKYRGNSAGGDAFGSAFGGKYLDKRNDAVAVVCASLSGSGTFTVSTTNLAVSALTKGSFSTGYDTITVTGPSVSEAAGTFYVRPASLGTQTTSGGHRYEMMGLRGLVTNEDLDTITMTDGTNSDAGSTNNDPLQGVSVDSYTWFKSIVDTHSSGRYAGQRALSLNLMQQMFDMVEEQAGKDYGPNLIYTTRAIRREYLELMQAIRSAVNTMKLDGGWEALEYNGVPFVVDNDAIDGEMYFLTTKDLQIFRMADWQWMEKDGSILSRVSGYDAYEAVLFSYAEFAVLNRATQGVICDIDYTKGDSEGYGG